MREKQLTFNKFFTFKRFILNSCNFNGALKITNLEKVAGILWGQANAKPTYLIEDTFVKLFDKQDEVDELSKLDLEKEGEDERLKTYQALKNDKPLKLDTVLIRKTLSWMTKSLRLEGKRFNPVTYEMAFDSMVTSTSSSFPEYVTPKVTMRAKVLKQIRSTSNTQKSEFIRKCLIGPAWRTQVNRSNNLKFRLFYPVSQFIQVIEKTVFYPFFQHFENNKRTCYAFANVFPDIQYRYQCWNRSKFAYSLDIKGFDINISNDLIKLIFDWLFLFLKHNELTKSQFAMIKDYHLTALIVTSIRGVVFIFRKRCGLLSGSVLTNFFGSMVSLFCVVYFCIDNRIYIKTSDISVHGDDVILATNEKLTIQFIAAYFKEHFNLEVSIEKSEIFKRGERVYYLGHYIDKNGRYLNIDRVAKQLYVSSHFIPTTVMNKSTRIISKFLSNVLKSKDGLDFFLSYSKNLIGLLNIKELPKYYLHFAIIEKTYEKKAISDAREVWFKT